MRSARGNIYISCATIQKKENYEKDGSRTKKKLPRCFCFYNNSVGAVFQATSKNGIDGLEYNLRMRVPM